MNLASALRARAVTNVLRRNPFAVTVLSQNPGSSMPSFHGVARSFLRTSPVQQTLFIPRAFSSQPRSDGSPSMPSTPGSPQQNPPTPGGDPTEAPQTQESKSRTVYLTRQEHLTHHLAVGQLPSPLHRPDLLISCLQTHSGTISWRLCLVRCHSGFHLGDDACREALCGGCSHVSCIPCVPTQLTISMLSAV